MPTKNLLNSKDEAALNEAVHAELYASHLYKHVANQMQRAGFFGAQKWFLKESADELVHYQRHADFLNDMGSVAVPPDIEGHTNTISTLRAALQLAYDTEYQLMLDYSKWYAGASPVVAQFLLQFLEIQRSSVGEYGDWLARLYLAGDDMAATLIIDKELAE